MNFPRFAVCLALYSAFRGALGDNLSKSNPDFEANYSEKGGSELTRRIIQRIFQAYSVLPSFPDPTPLENVFIIFPETGNLSVPSGNLWGLSDLTDELTVIEQADNVTTSLQLRVEVAQLSSNGTYESDMFYYDYVHFVGAGNYEITLTNFFITLDFDLHLDPVDSETLIVSGTNINFGFSRMVTWMENLLINEELADWEDPEIQLIFPQQVRVMLDLNMETWKSEAEIELNSLVEGCILDDIINGDLACTDPTNPQPSTSTSEPSTASDPTTASDATTASAATTASDPVSPSVSTSPSNPTTPTVATSTDPGETSTTAGSGKAELVILTIAMALCIILFYF